MTYEPGKLREDAARYDRMGERLDTDLMRAHADALEELARVKRAIAESCDEQRGEYFGCRRAERAEAALAESERKGREAGMREAAGILDARDKRAYEHIKSYAEDNKVSLADNQYLLGRGDEAHGAYRAILAAIGGQE